MELLNLLYLSLRALLNKSLRNSLVRCVFELRALVIEGEYPGEPSDITLSESARYALSFIVSTPLEKLFTFSLTDEALTELCNVSRLYRSRFIDRPLKSAQMLESFDAFY